MSTLQFMLQQNQQIQELPALQKEIYFRLAELFEDNDHALYCTPKELSTAYGIGNTSQWNDFLNLEPVKIYIQTQLAQNAKIAVRKSIPAIQKAAAAGDTQAFLQVSKMANLYDAGESNKIIVLHRVNRPKVTYERAE